MQLRIFAKNTPRLRLLDPWMRSSSIAWAAFNSISAALASIPARGHRPCPDGRASSRDGISPAHYDCGGTNNMAHPKRCSTGSGLRRLGRAQLVSKALGTSIITLCTGSRDLKDMCGAGRR